MKKFWYVTAFMLAACGPADTTTDEEQPTDEVKKDTVARVEELPVDTAKKEDVPANVDDPNATSIKAYEAANANGMSFCDCVKKQKELDDKLAGDITDEEMDALFAEKDKLIKGECKVLNMGAQTSPAQRAQREAMVKKCLTK